MTGRRLLFFGSVVLLLFVTAYEGVDLTRLHPRRRREEITTTVGTLAV
jgi:hypothetical protein